MALTLSGENWAKCYDSIAKAISIFLLSQSFREKGLVAEIEGILGQIKVLEMSSYI